MSLLVVAVVVETAVVVVEPVDSVLVRVCLLPLEPITRLRLAQVELEQQLLILRLVLIPYSALLPLRVVGKVEILLAPAP